MSECREVGLVDTTEGAWLGMFDGAYCDVGGRELGCEITEGFPDVIGCGFELMGGLLLGSKLGTESIPCSLEGEVDLLDEASDGSGVGLDKLDSAEGGSEASASSEGLVDIDGD